MENLDVVIIGAGIIGLAIGRALAQRGRDVTVLEANSDFGMETSSRNSEVIHAGIYYPENSLKAKLCVAGKNMLYAYCEKRAIPHSRVGKLIVAIEKHEIEVLAAYQHQALKNGVSDLTLISREQLSEMEPALSAEAALLSPSTGIVDSHEVMFNFLADITNNGGTLVCNSAVVNGQLTNEGPLIRIAGEAQSAYRCNLLVNCAGLKAPLTAAALGLDASHIPQSFFAKGHYFTLTGKSPFSRLIYPLANSAGLGTHVTLDLGNQARFGPDVEWVDEIDYAFDENRKASFVEAIRRYFPALDAAALRPGYTGIRPKIAGPSAPAADFMIQGESTHGAKGLINCFGIESPGLTASMAIGNYVAELAE